MNWDFIYRGEKKNLDDTARAAAGGSFVRLSQGCTHYELSGTPTTNAVSTTVVLIHGFSVPLFIWDPTFEALTSAGRRALRYDLFGRGLSDRPHVAYGISLFVRQLADLLVALQIEHVDLIGLSMGGAIAAAFSVEFPHRVHRLALIDPVGTEPMPLNLLYKTALLPGVSELILSLLGTENIVQSLASDFYDPAQVERFRERYRAQMQFHGFKRAIVSTLRNKTVNGFPGIYRRLGQLSIPVLLLWGREDHTLPIEQSRPILDLVPRAKFHIIEGSGHIPNCEKPDVTNPILLDFLS